jgi:tRNA-modifying protein YgfZ
MTNLRDLHTAKGASLAPDGIPLHFGDLKAEYHAALEHAVLMERSHEARIEMAGKDNLNLMHRISTNDLMNMAAGEGRPTIFTNPNARILDRAVVHNANNRVIILGEPGRGNALTQYLQRNIFFGDEARVTNLATTTYEFDLHGPKADTIINLLVPDAASLPAYHSREIVLADTPVFIARRKALSGARWTIIMPIEAGVDIWSHIIERGAAHGLLPAGSLTFNTLRIRAGVPGVGRELSQDYIPLEVGLWDEISFKKGCYTGQEIIARMESRGRLANTIVALRLSAMIESPTDIYHEGRTAGRLTSSAVSPDGEIFAIGVIKVPLAQVGQTLLVGSEKIQAEVSMLVGAQPPQLSAENVPH